MPLPEFNDLFHDSSSQDILDFLLSKLEANDLSSDEALAMLSAVHEKLEQGPVANPKIYKSYVNFMKFLQREKPDVYDYVISTWDRKNEKESSDVDNQEINFDESVVSASNSRSIEARAEKGFDVEKMADREANEAGENQEPEETEEKGTNEAERINEGRKEPKQEETEEKIEEEESDQKKDKGEEPEEPGDDKVDDLVDKPDIDEAREEEKEQVVEDLDSNEKEFELVEEAGTNKIPDESTTGSEKGEPEGGTGVEPGETEWPEVEDAQSEEQFDGLEGGDSPSSAED